MGHRIPLAHVRITPVAVAICLSVAAVCLAATRIESGWSGSSAPVRSASSTAPAPTAAGPGATVAAELEELAASRPRVRVEVIVRLAEGATPASARRAVLAARGRVTRELRLIDALGVRVPAGAVPELARNDAIASISPNARVRARAHDGLRDASALRTAYNGSTAAAAAWSAGATGKGVGVAVLDTGVAADLPDFRRSAEDESSRVVASKVVNDDATSGTDGLGHGTHVAGLIAGNGANRPDSDPLDGAYVGSAPEADLISVKVSDDEGGVTVLDVIEGLQWVVDHRRKHDIRVVNLSLTSTSTEPPSTDPLNAAVEEAWFAGIVVVVAAGNEGAAPDAVHYAPANDPYVITVGAVDDRGTQEPTDDVLAPWSSRGTTQDGVAKPDVLVPGAGLVSTLAPASRYAGLCPECVVEGEYLRIGGTSMAAAVASGAVAQILQARPGWTPDQVKGALSGTLRDVPGVGGEVQVADALAVADGDPRLEANVGLAPSRWFERVRGGDGRELDWRIASWRTASWRSASWRTASWRTASWRVSWSARFAK